MIDSPLIEFFVSNGMDDRGRVLLQIVSHSDEWLERTHDYIQWLFPLAEKSGANPTAPLICINLVSLFSFNAVAQKNMLLGLDRMLSFYGLQRNGKTISKGENWSIRKDNWFDHPTHNDLRITRMLKSMSILGFGEYAQALLDELLRLSNEPDCGFSEDAIRYWKAAILSKWNPQLEFPAANAEYMEATKEEIQQSITRLLSAVRRFSEKDGLDENELLRMNQLRFSVAVIARQTGVMSRSDFCNEADRNTANLANLLGGTAFSIDTH